MEDTTYFGYQKVKTNQKQKLVGGVFSSVADSYDLMNDVMSMGVHRLWKNKFIAMVNATNPIRMIDVAGGTGDIAMRLLKKSPDSHVTLCDINNDMLKNGKNNLLDNNMIKQADFICANAEDLPVEDSSYDYYTISFGIRNVTNIEKALKEAHRVLKPGGQFLCLEFSKPSSEIFKKIYDLYSFNVIPKMGQIFAKDSDSYQYLVESIRKFPSQNDFKQMIEDAGFYKAKYEDLTNGVVAIHSGWKV